MRREIFVSVVLLLLVVAGSFYFFSKYKGNEPSGHVAKALPPQTVMAFSSQKLDERLDALMAIRAFEGFGQDTLFTNLREEFEVVQSSFSGDSTLSWSGVLVVARASSSELGMLFLVDRNSLPNIGDNGSSKEIKDGFYQVQLEGQSVYAAEIEGGYAVSKHLGLVESSQGSSFVADQNLFYREVSGKQDFVLINYAALNWLLPGSFDLGRLHLQKGLKNLQGIGVYDISADDKSLTLMGAVKPSALNSSLQPKFHGEAQAMTAFNMLPENVPTFSIGTGIRISETLLSASSDPAFAASIDSFNQRNRVDLMQDFISGLGDETVSGLVAAFDHQISQNSYTMWKVTEKERLTLFLQALDSSFVPVEDSFSTGVTKESRMFTWLPGASAKTYGKTHFMLLGDFLVIGGSREVLEDLYRSVSSGAVFSNSTHYALMSDWISRESNLFLYANPLLCYALPIEVTLGSMVETYPRNIKHVKSLDIVACQMVKNNDRFFSHIYVHEAEGKGRQQVVQWRRQISSDVTYGPYLVPNYVSKTNDVLVADAKGKVTALDQNGRVRWTFNAEQPLLGSPKQLDVYSNNKIQYLMNTEKALRLLDRKGNEVSAYPIKLPDNVSGIPAVYDLKERKEYSIMVPCSNNKLYGYTGKGKPIPGWSPKNMLASAKGELQYFNKGGKDYYLFNDVEGNIYVWKTDGKEAVAPIATASPIISNLTLRFGPTLEKCKVLAFDAEGHLVTASLEGDVSKVLIDENLKNAQAQWYELDGNAGKELLVHKGSKIKVVQQNGRITTSITLEDVASHVQVLQGEEGEPLIAAVLPEKIVFHSANGAVVLELLQSNCNGHLSLDDFTKDGELDLVTSVGDEVLLIKNIF